jgi:O-acetyl-ADP-ribose deacetylase (regulator of RNase III)
LPQILAINVINKMIEYKIGNLLDADEQYIAHQCNCTSFYSAGIAHDIFKKYSYSDTYKDRKVDDIPGTIKIMGNGTDQRYIINMFGQHSPGGYSNSTLSIDSKKNREKYFYNCLLEISKIPKLESIAFPFRIGCGLAGGDWKYYLGTLENFAKYVEKSQNTKIFIYKREQDK